ncbi:DNA-binding response regulator [Nonomuraea sp. NPDC003560]
MDSRLIRGAIAAVLELEADITVVGETDRWECVQRTAQRCRPDVVVIDADMSGGSALTAVTQLRKHTPACRALLVTAHKSPELLRRAMKVNVSGILLKDSSTDELARGIKAIAAGEQVVDQELVIAVLNAEPNPLTKRETDILQMISTGAEPGEVARRLGLSIGTVRNYLATIVTKLDARNRVDAIRIAEESGWLLPADESEALFDAC